MYEAYYGFSELPFELTANPRFLVLPPRQREALSALQYGLLASRPVTLLIGEAGTGKTTLLTAALASDRCRAVRCVYVNNPLLDAAEFVRTLARRFDLGDEAASSKTLMLERLEARLRNARERGEVMALVIDEAQSLGLELLEEVRLLSNIETEQAKLLPLVLAGQPELAARLEASDLRQLRQRVTVRCELHAFELNETVAYIAGRVKAAGGNAVRLFSQEAIIDIHQRSAGIARTINVICDNALISGMALGQQKVTRTIVGSVCRDLGLGWPGGKLSSPPPQPAGAVEVVPSSPVRRAAGEASEETASGDAGSGENATDPQPEAPKRRRFSFPFRAAAGPLRTRIISE